MAEAAQKKVDTARQTAGDSQEAYDAFILAADELDRVNEQVERVGSGMSALVDAAGTMADEDAAIKRRHYHGERVRMNFQLLGKWYDGTVIAYVPTRSTKSVIYYRVKFDDDKSGLYTEQGIIAGMAAYADVGGTAAAGGAGVTSLLY